MNTYPFGATVRIKCTFTDPAGALGDPTTVTLKVEGPDGVETTYTDAVKDAVGLYHRDILVSGSGYWSYRWIGTGAIAQVDEDQFQVATSAFA